MANEQNLVNIAMRSEREQLEIRRKAAETTNNIKKKKKLMREDAANFLEMPLSDKALDDVKFLSEVKGANITVQQAILLAMIKKAMKGDRGAAEYVRDTAGQKPVDNLNIDAGMSESLSNIMQAFQKGSELE